MSQETKKDQSDKNFEKTALYIAVLLGMEHKSYEELAAVPEDLDKVVVKIHSDKDLLHRVMSDKRMSTKAMKEEAQEVAVPGIKYMRVVTVGDDKVCPACKPWQGKILSVDGVDKNYPSVDDFIASEGFHIGCRCSLQELDVQEIPRKPPNPRAAQNMCCCHNHQKLIFS